MKLSLILKKNIYSFDEQFFSNELKDNLVKTLLCIYLSLIFLGVLGVLLLRFAQLFADKVNCFNTLFTTKTLLM